MRQIEISADSVTAIAQLNDSKTAEAIWQALPIEGEANTWGDEIYFAIPVKIGEENPQELVEKGDLGYWPPGKAFCIFFGPTLSSSGDEIRPASAVNVFGKIVGDATVFKRVTDGSRISIKRTGEN